MTGSNSTSAHDEGPIARHMAGAAARSSREALRIHDEANIELEELRAMLAMINGEGIELFQGMNDGLQSAYLYGCMRRTERLAQLFAEQRLLSSPSANA